MERSQEGSSIPSHTPSYNEWHHEGDTHDDQYEAEILHYYKGLIHAAHSDTYILVHDIIDDESMNLSIIGFPPDCMKLPKVPIKLITLNIDLYENVQIFCIWYSVFTSSILNYGTCLVSSSLFINVLIDVCL